MDVKRGAILTVLYKYQEPGNRGDNKPNPPISGEKKVFRVEERLFT
jgi:hypothetical protein